MPTLGIEIKNRTAPPAAGTFSGTDTAFLVGLADQGAANTAILCESVSDYETAFGKRSTTNTTLYDSVDVFFREGGARTYVSRVVGPGAINATVTLNDSAVKPTLKVTAKSPGAYANGYKIVVTTEGGKFKLEVQNAAAEVLESHAGINSRQEATELSWTYVTVALTGSSVLNPEKGTVELTTGTDDRGSITGGAIKTAWEAALTGFAKKSFGSGQVAAPGQNNLTVQTLLLNAAQEFNRVALLDLGKGTEAELVALLTPVTALANAEYGAAFAGNLVAPASVPGTTRNIPASAVAAALAARGDATGSPNVAPCGLNYPLLYCTGTDTDFSESERNALFQAGGNSFHVEYGVLALYGWQTPVLATTSTIYDQFNHSRTRMAIQAKARVLGAHYQFSNIDGGGAVFNSFKQDLGKALKELWNANALFGETPDEAFLVRVEPPINNATTIEKQELKAVAEVRMSPYASFVVIELVTVPTSQLV